MDNAAIIEVVILSGRIIYTLDRINILGCHVEARIFMLFLVSEFVRGLNNQTVMTPRISL